jgi:hypothetical protein
VKKWIKGRESAADGLETLPASRYTARGSAVGPAPTGGGNVVKNPNKSRKNSVMAYPCEGFEQVA